MRSSSHHSEGTSNAIQMFIPEATGVGRQKFPQGALDDSNKPLHLSLASGS